MGLDIHSERGQSTLIDLNRAVAIFHAAHDQFRYFKTDEDLPARADGIIIDLDARRFEGVTETKCRYDCTLESFFSAFNGEWLVTRDKLIDCYTVAALMQVRLWGFLYLVDSDILMIKRLWSPRQGWLTRIRSQETRTKRSINGGSVLRLNSFIDMHDAIQLAGSSTIGLQDGAASDKPEAP